MTAIDPSAPPRTWPAISVVMPIRNEAAHLVEAVERVLDQGYPGALDVVLAVGPSKDGTEDIAAELAARDPRVQVVANPTGLTPAGLNAALRVVSAPIVARVDGHALLSPHYLRRAVELLEATGAANVGGVMAAQGSTDLESAVACAMRSPLGVGGSRFHTGGKAGPADTVYLGVFRREVLDELGGYDESFLRAQDWELNHRIRAAGQLIWFSPELEVTYRPRGSLGSLATQYRHYGRWRAEIIRRDASTANLRYLAPPTVVVAVLVGTAIGLSGRRWGWVAPGGYLSGALLGGLWIGRGMPWRSRALVPLVLATMHASWGFGFLTSPGDLRRRGTV